jgi:osmotically-inducible protein OsmY
MRLGRLVLLLALLAPAAMPAVGCGQTVNRSVDDAGITTRVKTALLNEPDLSALAINVATTNGVVTLSGIVKSVAERDRAVEVVRRMNGVVDVKSSLQVAAGD